MEPIQALRFRLINQILEPYFANGSLILLHCNYGYLCFTTANLHKRFGKSGNGQWQDLEDMFYFTISFDAEDKDTLKEKGIDIELWCYAPSDVRAEYGARLSGREELGSIYSKKGFDLMYKLEIVPLKEKKEEQALNTQKLQRTLLWFIQTKLPAIERAILQ